MGMLSSGVAWMMGQMKASCSVTGVYQILGGATVNGVVATPGKTEFAIEDGQQVRLENNQVDWIFTPSDLPFNYVTTKPKRGDTWATGGRTYEVMQPDGVDQPYRLDPTGNLLRIHSKRVA